MKVFKQEGTIMAFFIFQEENSGSRVYERLVRREFETGTSGKCLQ